MQKFVRWLVIAIAVVWVVNDPVAAARLAHQVVAWLATAAHSLSTLVSGLSGGNQR